MPGFGGVIVDVLDGPRWDLALTLIESGESPVHLGEIQIRRDVAGPAADGVICLTLEVTERADIEVGLTALAQGKRIADDAASTDPRFAGLLDRYGCRWEVVYNYGMGSVLLGRADAAGPLTWLG